MHRSLIILFAASLLAACSDEGSPAAYNTQLHGQDYLLEVVVEDPVNQMSSGFFVDDEGRIMGFGTAYGGAFTLLDDSDLNSSQDLVDRYAGSLLLMQLPQEAMPSVFQFIARAAHGPLTVDTQAGPIGVTEVEAVRAFRFLPALDQYEVVILLRCKDGEQVINRSNAGAELLDRARRYAQFVGITDLCSLSPEF
jgi:hypothetical protein